MSDATAAGSSAGGFLEGLLEGGQAGYGFREGIKSRRRAQQLQADLMTLRQQENARQQEQAGREATVFDEQQTAYHRAERLRAEVAAHLAVPIKQTLGEYMGGRPGTRRPGAAPLSPEANTAMQVGRTLGDFAERPLTDDQALLVGSGEVPSSAIQPKAYHPRTRAEWLSNLRIAAGLRGGAARLPITMDHAFTVLDRIYNTQDPTTGEWHNSLRPADRLRIAKKMMDGTVQAGDFPDIKDSAPPAPTAPAQPAPGGGIFDRVRSWFHGKPAAVPATGGGVSGGAGAAASPDVIEQARALIGQYRDLSQEELEGVLREQGFDDETIRTILGGTPP